MPRLMRGSAIMSSNLIWSAPSTSSLAIEGAKLAAQFERFPLRAPFCIAGHTFISCEVLTVTLQSGGHIGRGEAAGVFYRNDGVDAMLSRVETVRAAIERRVTRESLQGLLPIGGARNAIDCALWDLQAKLSGRAAWQLAGLRPPRPLVSLFTLSAHEPAVMAATARSLVDARALKLKLTGRPEDVERLKEVRAARPDVALAIDANQSFTRSFLESIMPVLIDAGVELIEQPVAMGDEAQLEGLQSPIPIAADESAQGLRDLASLVGRFQVVNIKLDKCGGLTEGLAMAREARRLGLDAMVGNMLGSSLAMAPAALVGQLCRFVDLDGPVFLSEDRSPAARFADGAISFPQTLWGYPVDSEPRP
jgi:L-Ala-D/L-Glu epimerase